MTRYLGSSRWGWAVLLAALVSGPSFAEGVPTTPTGLNDITGDDVISATIVYYLENKKVGKKLVEDASSLVKAKTHPFTVNATWIVARTAHGLKDAKIGEQFYRLQIDQAVDLESGEKLARSFAGLIELLFDNKKFEEAEKVCREFLELEAGDSIDNRKPIVFRQMILIMARQGQYDRSHELLDRMIRANPKNWLNHELKGRLYRDEGKYKDAVKVYEDVIEKVDGDDRLNQEQKDLFANDIRYALSGVYVELKEIDKAAGHLQTLLKKEPENATYHNDLGYIWADNDKNLKKSEELIRKALELDKKQAIKADPNLDPKEYKANPAYLDSLGWVLYKLGKYDEAKKYLLDSVAQEGGRHLEIYDHLGDVYLKLGDKDQALDSFKKGIKTATDTDRDKERKKKVEKKIAELTK